MSRRWYLHFRDTCFPAAPLLSPIYLEHTYDKSETVRRGTVDANNCDGQTVLACFLFECSHSGAGVLHLRELQVLRRVCVV